MDEIGTTAASAQVGLTRDDFMRRVLGELAGTLQRVVGIEEASGYISIVGVALGEYVNTEYRQALAVERLTRQQVSDVLVDLKRRIGSDFRVLEESEDRIVLGNTTCPFGHFVQGRPSLCMMTSNLFGFVTAENLGYAAVELQRTIAQGHHGCRVVVHLRAADTNIGHEYFRRDDST